ncbi:MAG: 5-formyltetrahydrofolate cyclo-ligase [Rugosibacter sp.]|nr:5-formyltetrahydrofolate cyclo-ligase [Rugosibacter sp.]
MSNDSTFTKEAVDSSAFRAALRQEKLAARAALLPEEYAQRAQSLEQHLILFLANYPQTHPAISLPMIAFCTAIKNEFDAQPLVTRLLQQGWKAAMPVVTAPDTAMIFRAWQPGIPMSQDRYGIPIPATGEAVTPDIVLLPLVAFDAMGYRLGYGGGFFDRTLATLVPCPMAIGVGFELARVPSILPQAHDESLDAIVTESGVMQFERH